MNFETLRYLSNFDKVIEIGCSRAGVCGGSIGPPIRKRYRRQTQILPNNNIRSYSLHSLFINITTLRLIKSRQVS